MISFHSAITRGVILVAIGLDLGKDEDGFLGVPYLCQPSRQSREEWCPDEQKDCGDELDPPSGPE